MFILNTTKYNFQCFFEYNVRTLLLLSEKEHNFIVYETGIEFYLFVIEFYLFVLQYR